MNKLNAIAFGKAAAIASAFIMLSLGIAANFGIYVGAAEQMQRWHMFFDFSFLGIMGGMIEAAVISFVFGYIFSYLYNLFI